MMNCEKFSDEELVAKTLDVQDYFGCLIDRYESKLLRYILRLTSVSISDAEDILQEIFIDVYKNLNAFNQDLRFSSWIYRIAHNRIISTWRKNKNNPIVFKEEDGLVLFDKIAKEDDTFEKLMREDLNNDIKDIFSKMKKEYAEILILKFLEDKSYNEISDILKKPKGTVATMINRAKKQFRKIVDDYEKFKI